MVYPLVIGVKGFIGSHFFARLAPRVIGTHHAPSPGLELFDLALPSALPPCSFALIAAGMGNPRDCERDRAASYQCNVEGPLALCDELLDRGIKPVLFSTDYVFDGTKAPYLVGDAPSPLNIYGRQKAELERRAPKEALIIRLSKVYGTLFTEMAELMLAGKVVRVAHDQIFAPIYIEDVVTGVLDLIERGACGLYQFAGPQAASRLEMAKKVAAHLNLSDAKIVPITLDELNDGVLRPKNTTLVPSVASRPFDEVLCHSLKNLCGKRPALLCPNAP